MEISTQEVVVAKVKTFLRFFFFLSSQSLILSSVDSPVHHLNNIDHIYRQHKKITLTFIQSTTSIPEQLQAQA